MRTKQANIFKRIVVTVAVLVVHVQGERLTVPYLTLTAFLAHADRAQQVKA